MLLTFIEAGIIRMTTGTLPTSVYIEGPARAVHYRGALTWKRPAKGTRLDVRRSANRKSIESGTRKQRYTKVR